MNEPVQVRGPRRPKEVRVDLERGLAYIRIRDGNVARTIEHESEPNVWLDVDCEGLLVGIEILGPIDTVRVADAAERYLGPKAAQADSEIIKRTVESVERLLETAK